MTWHEHENYDKFLYNEMIKIIIYSDKRIILYKNINICEFLLISIHCILHTTG